MSQQRLRITHRRVGPARELPQGQLARTWVRAFECAGLELARPEGSKRVRIDVGPPLPLGAAGERELLDVWLAAPVAPDELVRRLAVATPPGLEPVAAEELGERLPSLQASARAAHYLVTFPADAVDAQALRARVEALLTMPTLDWEELRGERLRRYDLRAVVYDLEVIEESGQVALRMRLELRPERAGRPMSVLAALEVEVESVSLVRTAIEVERPRVALRAWRERGRFE